MIYVGAGGVDLLIIADLNLKVRLLFLDLSHSLHQQMNKLQFLLKTEIQLKAIKATKWTVLNLFSPVLSVNFHALI